MTMDPTPDPTPAAASTAAPLAAPPSVPFPLQKGEQILAVVRRHWWFLWPRTLLWAAFALGGPVVVAWLLDLINLYDNVESWYWIAAGLWLVFWAVRIILNWYQYYNDIWVITDQRIVDSRKPHPLRHSLASADLVNIQDMTVEKRGIFANIFGFGDVNCQTAAAKHLFILAGIPKPAEVQLMVDAERDRERKGGARSAL
jgi:hypothetical protein